MENGEIDYQEMLMSGTAMSRQKSRRATRSDVPQCINAFDEERKQKNSTMSLNYQNTKRGLCQEGGKHMQFVIPTVKTLSSTKTFVSDKPIITQQKPEPGIVKTP
jgi:hypothetical protein